MYSIVLFVLVILVVKLFISVIVLMIVHYVMLNSEQRCPVKSWSPSYYHCTLKEWIQLEDAFETLSILINYWGPLEDSSAHINVPEPLTLSDVAVCSLHFFHQQRTFGNYGGNIEGPQLIVVTLWVEDRVRKPVYALSLSPTGPTVWKHGFIPVIYFLAIINSFNAGLLFVQWHWKRMLMVLQAH